MAYRARSSKIRFLRTNIRQHTRPTRLASTAPSAVEPAGEEATTATSYSAEELDAMSFNDLRAMATERGMDSTGKKAELVERLANG